jgi:curved DNA-binding protein CbpA
MYDVTPYQVLGVARTATAKQIRTSYYAHVKIRHPDKDTDPSANAMVSITITKT